MRIIEFQRANGLADELPRELSIKDGRLIQKPVRELENLRTNKVEYKNVAFEDVIRLDGVSGRCVDMEITLRPGDAQDIYKNLQFVLLRMKPIILQ